ncbi:MAG: alpha/beta hydrolase [Planctomycetes bacterium]|nr:alpha/beta hydrolase [Planctomycetota bacterium]
MRLVSCAAVVQCLVAPWPIWLPGFYRTRWCRKERSTILLTGASSSSNARQCMRLVTLFGQFSQLDLTRGEGSSTSPRGSHRPLLRSGQDGQLTVRYVRHAVSSTGRMSTTRIEMSETPTKDVLIMVHGTGTSPESGEGDRWWQHGSSASTELKGRLPDDLFCSGPHEVFRWSGENSERARIMAGRRLLACLESLEEKGQGYHLIGHSHGGSVIWHALQLATSRGKPLDQLRSWATVGTPFLQYRTRSFLNAVNVFNLLLAIALMKPALTAFSPNFF